MSVPETHLGIVVSPWVPLGCDSFSDILVFDDLNGFEAC